MKETFYFSHDYNARRDPKILEMLYDYKVVGYGLFWAVVEMMAEENDHKLKKDDRTYKAIALEMQCERTEVVKWVNDCINIYSLFKSDDEYFWSNSFMNRLKIREEKSEKARAAANSRWKKNVDVKPFNQGNTQNSENANALQTESENPKRNAIKERKGKEINNIPFQDIFNLYQKQKIISHKTLTKDMKEAIKKAASKYSIEDIKKAITRYGLMFHDTKNEYAASYCKYQWTLKELMTREKGISEFLDEGGKWLRYNEIKENTDNRSNAGAYKIID